MKKKEFIQMIGSILLLVVATFLPNSTIKFILLILSYILVGFDVILEALKNLRKKFLFDEHFLMSIATIGAFFIGEYEEAIMVMVLYTIGELFTDHAVDRSKEEISKLMEIRPDYATVLIHDTEKKVSPKQVKIKDHILIKNGEKVPLDGIIIDGSSTLDMSPLTGESIPKVVQKKDFVYSGCINLGGTLIVQVEKEYKETTVYKILKLVEEAGDKKSKSEKFITKFSKYYTPIVVGIAFLIGVLLPLLFSFPLEIYLKRAFTFLVISCPCALVISVPLGFFCGIGGASRAGILIKGSTFLEKFSKIDTFVFDKTGTLTQGTFEVVDVHLKEMEKEELLEYAAYCEKDSNHPIAFSIKKYYGKPLNQRKVKNIKEMAGFGASATVDQKEVRVGNWKYMEKINVHVDFYSSNKTIIYVVIDGIYQGALEIDDVIKKEAKPMMQSLRSLGIKNLVMLTGDKKEVAKRVSKELSLDTYYADLLPADKVKKVEELLKKGTVAFVGDGINDAPVLAMSDVGISMGNIGSDAAIEASDVVIMSDQLEKIPLAIQISRKTMKIIKQNILFAISIKLIILVFGVFGLTNMWMAVLADVGVSILAILNSIRAFQIKEKV